MFECLVVTTVTTTKWRMQDKNQGITSNKHISKMEYMFAHFVLLITRELCKKVTDRNRQKNTDYTKDVLHLYPCSHFSRHFTLTFQDSMLIKFTHLFVDYIFSHMIKFH